MLEEPLRHQLILQGYERGYTDLVYVQTGQNKSRC
jgi:hypothetical protein